MEKVNWQCILEAESLTSTTTSKIAFTPAQFASMVSKACKDRTVLLHRTLYVIRYLQTVFIFVNQQKQP